MKRILDAPVWDDKSPCLYYNINYYFMNVGCRTYIHCLHLGNQMFLYLVSNWFNGFFRNFSGAKQFTSIIILIVPLHWFRPWEPCQMDDLTSRVITLSFRNCISDNFGTCGFIEKQASQFDVALCVYYARAVSIGGHYFRSITFTRTKVAQWQGWTKCGF